MLLLSLIYRGRATTILTVGFASGILLPWFNNNAFSLAGMIIYGISSIACIVYGFRRKRMTTLKKTTIILSGIMALFIHVIASLMHYPQTNLLIAMAFLPIAGYITLIFSNSLYRKKEVSFLTIINCNLILNFIPDIFVI